ncbi:MAG: phytanoyl-CoA dioxygenase family protein [Chitinophagales bacterium]
MGNSVFEESNVMNDLAEKGVAKCILFSREELERIASIVSNIHSKASVASREFFLSITSDFLQAQFIEESMSFFKGMIVNKMNGYKLISITYHVKENNSMSQVAIHQDWQYVQEPDFNSYTVWTPLCDVDEKNGGLFFFEGSHKVVNQLRGKGLQNDLTSYSIQNAICYRVSFGESLVFNSRMVHFSPANQSKKDRYSIGAAVCKSNAQLFLHQKSDAGIDSKEVSDDFYFSFNEFS